MSFVKSVQLDDENGNPYGVKHVQNKPRVVSTPYYDEISSGSIPNHTTIHIPAFEPAISLIEKDVWPLATLAIPLPLVATAMQVVSTSALDGVAGTGVQNVRVYGLDVSGLEVVQTVVMNGITPVLIPTPLLRINFVEAVAPIGTLGVAAGQISITDVATGLVIYSVIRIGQVSSESALVSVPTGKTGHLVSWTSSGTAKETVFYLKATMAFDGTIQPGIFRTIAELGFKDNAHTQLFVMPFILPPLCDLKISAVDIGGAGTGTAAASFELFFEV